jgi:hypothetical protein
MAHDFLVRVAAAVALDIRLGFPFRVGNELARFVAAQEFFRQAPPLLDQQKDFGARTP